MKIFFTIFAALIWSISAWHFLFPNAVEAQAATRVDVAVFDTDINPFTAGYIERVLNVANGDGAQALIIELDTPGGRLDAMDDIIKAILNSNIPVVVYVYPPGARAASAGTFVTYAAHIAAMAPGTNIGAAHPVLEGGANITSTVGSDELDKTMNDAVARIRMLAGQRGRNADWAEKAVRESVSVSAKDALDLHVIDLIAQDVPDLLNQIDGRTVTVVGNREVTLHTRGAMPNELDMTIIEEVLQVIADPNIAAILLSIGSLAILVELYNPGATLPAIVGVICITLALAASYALPTNYAALILVVAAFVMFVLDVKVNSLVLTAGAIIAFVLGMVFLFRPFTPPAPTAPEVAVSPILIAGLTLLMVSFFLVIVRAAVRSRRSPVVTGTAPLWGASGVATSELNPDGTVRVRSEDWTATAEGAPIHKGEKVQVAAVDGLRLRVFKKE